MSVRDDGYAVLPQLLSCAEVRVARADVERILRAPAGPSCERAHNTLVPLRWDTPLVRRVLDRRAARVAEAAGGDDLRWISGYVSVKDPHSEPLDWHQDWWCWDHPVSLRPDPAQVALLVYLTDTSERNAALRVRPGSHRGDPRPARTLPLRAGDAALIDYRLEHGTHANLTPDRRDCLILNFAPAWRALPEDIRGHLIQHPALPCDDEPAHALPWLPRYDGPRVDLPLNRTPRAPAL
jgi:hypothetical protein